MLEEIDLTTEDGTGHSLADPGPFEGVVGRSSVDYLLTNAVAEMSALTAQADMKGSVVITASSIVLSIASTQFGDSALRWSLVTLVVFVLLALLSSVLAVFPKFKIHPEPGDRLPFGADVYPGHKANDTVLWVESRRAVISGDTLVDFGQGLEINERWLRPGVTLEEIAEGLRPLLALPVEHVLATHGGPTDRAALERALSF